MREGRCQRDGGSQKTAPTDKRGACRGGWPAVGDGRPLPPSRGPAPRSRGRHLGDWLAMQQKCSLEVPLLHRPPQPFRDRYFLCKCTFKEDSTLQTLNLSNFALRNAFTHSFQKYGLDSSWALWPRVQRGCSVSVTGESGRVQKTRRGDDEGWAARAGVWGHISSPGGDEVCQLHL